ncbi:MAG: DUF1592 domain-containing protein [Planctomycetes bacterium]|nr:DUF1592 domain-containing protein [Planctomycetota bacterium]
MLRLLSAATVVWLAPALAAQTTAPSAVSDVLESTCFDCHSGTTPKADLDLATLDLRSERDRLGILLDVRNKVTGREMPPTDFGALDDEELTTLVAWVEQRLGERLGTIDLDPGVVAVRRLSRTEYDHTIRDLFGVRTDSSRRFPAESLGYGFDNIGDGADFSTLHIEKYYDAAADVARQVVDVADPANPTKRRVLGADASVDGGGRTRGEAAYLYARGTVSTRFELPRSGDYRLEVRACGDQAGDEPVRIGISIDHNRVEVLEVPEPRDAPGLYTIDLTLGDGPVLVEATFLNDYYKPDDPDPKQRDRNMILEDFVLTGPLDTRLPRGSEWLFAADPGVKQKPRKRALEIAKVLTERAWRGQVDRKEVHRLADLVADVCKGGESFPYGLRALVEAVLVSPRFLCRVERPGTRTLDDFELATRLSYFLWSSTPDEPLLDLAKRGQLRDPEVLTAQTERMLDDPRSTALATNFAAQWLELRNLEVLQPDPDRFPAFDDKLRSAMQRETELLFEAVMREKRSVYDLCDANFTFVNGPLAAHYGIEHVEGPEFRRVRAPRPGGILGHASVLTVTSNPTRTSPVKRGKWLLDNLLDAPPPPPAPGFDSFEDEQAAERPATLREQLALHRKDPKCAVCHDRMDALGLTLERFDPIGARREADDGQDIDARGSLPGGQVIEDLEGIRSVLNDNPAFLRCLLRKLFIYAIGRDTTTDDRLALERLQRSLHGHDSTIEDLVLGIVGLDAFRAIDDSRRPTK